MTFPLDDLVPMQLWRVAVREEHGETSVVLLKEEHGERILPIAVGYCEAAAIRRSVEEKAGGRIALRPLTHELVVKAVEGLRGRIERGIITRLEQETFFACLVVRPAPGAAGADTSVAPGEEVVLDARPSDVISVCLAAGCVLYALRPLLEEISEEE